MSEAAQEEPEVRAVRGPLRWLFLGLGFLFVGLGGLGVVLPGLPTTPFMLLAAWMFSKSSPRFHTWLWSHRLFGPYVRAWAQHRVIPFRVKIIASSAMAIGLAAMIVRALPAYVVVLTALVCVAGVIFIWRCPSQAPEVSAS